MTRVDPKNTKKCQFYDIKVFFSGLLDQLLIFPCWKIAWEMSWMPLKYCALLYSKWKFVFSNFYLIKILKIKHLENLQGGILKNCLKCTYIYEAIVEHICDFQPKYTNWEFLIPSRLCAGDIIEWVLFFYKNNRVLFSP